MLHIWCDYRMMVRKKVTLLLWASISAFQMKMMNINMEVGFLRLSA